MIPKKKKRNEESGSAISFHLASVPSLIHIKMSAIPYNMATIFVYANHFADLSTFLKRKIAPAIIKEIITLYASSATLTA